MPDFERDEATISAYESAKLRYIRAITQDAEIKLREAFGKRREAINDEITNLRSLAKVRGDAATAAAQKYAVKLPHRVRKSGVRPPSFWERLITFNAVDRYYRTAQKAAEELDEVNELLRKRRDRLDAMERETRRSIYLREEAVRKKLQTPEGLAALHADPMVKAAFAKMQGVMNERAKYDERVKRGEVPSEEARDREMAQRGMKFAVVPLEGVMISRIARYGELEYYVLRDLSNHEYMISCDPALRAVARRGVRYLSAPRRAMKSLVAPHARRCTDARARPPHGWFLQQRRDRSLRASPGRAAHRPGHAEDASARRERSGDDRDVGSVGRSRAQACRLTSGKRRRNS